MDKLGKFRTGESGSGKLNTSPTQEKKPLWLVQSSDTNQLFGEHIGQLEGHCSRWRIDVHITGEGLLQWHWR